MTTFTMQDLNQLPNTPEEDEAMEALAKLGAGIDLKQMFNDMGSMYVGEGKTNIMGEVLPNPTLTDIINNICAQLQLLTTVIGEQARGNSHVEDQSLQECVSLTLQQADWFKNLVRYELIGAGIEDLAKDAVQEVVESEVESYFENNFDPSYHFDFDDAVHDAVGDRIDDVVADKIDDVVDAYLSNATISISK